jgi:hypothetical protein
VAAMAPDAGLGEDFQWVGRPAAARRWA